MARLTKDRLEELREDFDFNDGNRDGRLSFDEFRSFLAELDAEVSEDEALIGFEEIDANGSGSISFDEFVAWWTSR